MQRILHILVLLLLFLPVFAQQDPMYSQFMFNKLALNPAYAGSHEQMSVRLLGRRQWMGFDGAPKTENIAFHLPTGNLRHGFGLNLVNDRVGYTNTTLITGNYAYILPIGEEGHLSFGLNLGMKSYWARYSKVPLQDGSDVAFGGGLDFTKTLFVAGTGVYFRNEHFFVGVSVPNLVPHKLYDPSYGYLSNHSVTHAFVMAGAALPMGESLELRPSALLRYANGAPIGLDLGAALRIKDIFQIGAMWRPSNSIALMTQIYFGKNIYLGYAYDLGLNALKNVSNGGHELSIGIDFSLSKGSVVDSKVF